MKLKKTHASNIKNENNNNKWMKIERHTNKTENDDNKRPINEAKSRHYTFLNRLFKAFYEIELDTR